MKRIVLHSITLTNWRGEKQRTTRFHVDSVTSICGDNGVGKSRHFDAFCWLLFGKDSQDRKDFELRTYDAHHEPLHHCECSVSAEMSVDGDLVVLKREYKEEWVKPRGQAEEVLKGNITECTWNGVPVKVSDYQKRIRENIIDETVFKMITNPRYFAEKMKWQLQREQLLQMAGAKSDAEIANGNEDFQALLDELGGKSLSDFRKEVAVQKSRLKEEMSGIRPRIDQVQKMMPEAEDWDVLEAEQYALRKQIDDISLQLESSGKRSDAQQERISKLQSRIYDLQGKQDEAQYAYVKKLHDDVNKQNEERHAIEQECKETSSKISENDIDIRHTEDRISYLQEQIKRLDHELGELREEWYVISAKEYDGSDTCPHCGQRLPEGMIADAKNVFTQHKMKELEANNERGKGLSEQMKSYKAELETKQEELNGLKEKKSDYAKRMQQLYDELAKHPAAKVGTYQTKDIPGWEDMQTEINKLNEQISALSVSKDDEAISSLRAKREELQGRYHELNIRLGNRKLIDNGNAEISRLENRGKELAQQIAALEGREFVAAEFSKKKIKDCEERVNSLFSLVRFQLFDTTQEGNEFECCTPMMDGIPYGVVNTAGKLNMGLDIINTLCRFNSVSAPIFIDSAESVNHPIETQSQLIFLRVTTDKELVIK